MCKKCKKTDEIPFCSMQARLDRAGIETIQSESKKPNEAKLKYEGKTIFRGYASNCVYACKIAFNLYIQKLTPIRHKTIKLYYYGINHGLFKKKDK